MNGAVSMHFDRVDASRTDTRLRDGVLALLDRLEALHAAPTRAVACAYCRARAGEPCTSRDGRELYLERRRRHPRRGEPSYHAPRIRAARAAVRDASIAAWREDLLVRGRRPARVLLAVQCSRVFRLASEVGAVWADVDVEPMPARTTWCATEVEA